MPPTDACPENPVYTTGGTVILSSETPLASSCSVMDSSGYAGVRLRGISFLFQLQTMCSDDQRRSERTIVT